MKIIFLDIDGVLNSYNDHKDLPEYSYYKKRRDRSEKKGSIEWHANEFSPIGVERLNQIIEATGAKVVISSSWRMAYRYEKIFDILKYRNFKGKVIDSTPVKMSIYDRGDEVRWWLRDALKQGLKIETFVILDDVDYRGFFRDADEYGPGLNGHFIHIADGDGLKEEHVERAIDILMNTELETYVSEQDDSDFGD